jgi:hypothetical protein
VVVVVVAQWWCTVVASGMAVLAAAGGCCRWLLLVVVFASAQGGHGVNGLLVGCRAGSGSLGLCVGHATGEVAERFLFGGIDGHIQQVGAGEEECFAPLGGPVEGTIVVGKGAHTS